MKPLANIHSTPSRSGRIANISTVLRLARLAQQPERSMDNGIGELREEMIARVAWLNAETIARVAGLNEEINATIAGLNEEMSARLAALNQAMIARFEGVDQRLNEAFAAVTQQLVEGRAYTDFAYERLDKADQTLNAGIARLERKLDRILAIVTESRARPR